MNILKIIKEFEGIFGAILGVVSTLFATELLRRYGKLRFYNISFNRSFISFNDILDNGSVSLEFILDIFNSSNIQKIMRDITIQFFNNSDMRLEVVPLLETDIKFKDQVKKPIIFDINNILPKELQRVHLHIFIYSENLPKIIDTDHIYLKFTNENNMTKKFLLHNGD